MDKKKSRREFIEFGLKTGITLPFLASSLYSCNSDPEKKEDAQKSNPKKLNILILGGTSFLGPHQIAYAIGKGLSLIHI